MGIALFISSFTGYMIGLFMGKRYAQKKIQEMRLELGLDAETGENKNERDI